MTWDRVGRVWGGKPDDQEYSEKVEQLEELKQREKKGEIDLISLEESGFSLVPYFGIAGKKKENKFRLKVKKARG